MTSGEAPAGKPLSADEYAARHDSALDFETVCLAARQQHNLAQLAALQPAVVLEVGCGPELLSLQAFAAPNRIRQWVAVEPATRWAEGARAVAKSEPRLHVVHDYMEGAATALGALWVRSRLPTSSSSPASSTRPPRPMPCSRRPCNGWRPAGTCW